MIAGYPDPNCTMAIMSIVCDKMKGEERQACLKGARDAHLMYPDFYNSSEAYAIGLSETYRTCMPHIYVYNDWAENQNCNCH